MKYIDKIFFEDLIKDVKNQYIRDIIEILCEGAEEVFCFSPDEHNILDTKLITCMPFLHNTHDCVNMLIGIGIGLRVANLRQNREERLVND
jgi:hypothetical protein